MQRPLVMSLAALLMSPVAPAQRTPTVPMAAVSEETALTQQTKIRYLLRQLDLKVEQRRYAQDLFATLLDDEVNPPFSFELIQSIVRELQEATAQGDEERIKQLEQELRDLGQGYDREGDFFTSMEAVLTDEQKATLREARRRLERHPSGALRPVDVFRAARRLNLTKDQRARLNELHKTFREKMREIKSLDDEVRFQLMNGLLGLVKAELTPEQQPDFELSIRRLRPDLAFRGLKARIPRTQPAAKDEKENPSDE